MASKNYDIIFLALPRWDGPYASTAFSLAQQLAKHTRVFYIDNPYTWKDVFSGWSKSSIKNRKKALLHGKENIKTIANQLFAVTPKAVLPINFLPAGGVYDVLTNYNNSIVSAGLNKLIKENRISKYVLINSFNPFYSPLQLSIKPLDTIYQSVDNIEHSNYVAKHGSRKEKEIAGIADLVITTSTQLTEKLRPFSKKIVCIPNAADIALFSKAMNEILPKPKEWETIGDKKVIVYTGNICHRLDYELLLAVATSNPDKILLMVGPSKNKLYEKWDLQLQANVLFVGSKKPEELPAYLQYSHCAIIPFLCNELTASIYPLKINEYLAAGKPVVSTNFSKDINDFGDIISLGTNQSAFLLAINKEIEEDTEDLKWKRNKRASQNTWEQRCDLLLDKIDELVLLQND